MMKLYSMKNSSRSFPSVSKYVCGGSSKLLIQQKA